MYTIQHIKDQNIIEIKNAKTSVYGKIYLNLGASLQELTLDGHEIIKDLNPLTYANTYASSILFPFANRVKDGKYKYKRKSYQLEKNQEEEQNAMHGLVYNKTFSVIEQHCSKESAEITLEYVELNHSIGFPFTYSVQVQYIFTQNNLSLKIHVKNTDSKPFPFTLGWHPYFSSEDLYNSSLFFDSNIKLKIGERNITTGTKYITAVKQFPIKDKQLDDCWILNSDVIQFKTPKYKLSINSSVEDNFLQVYTPPKPNTIAIEPTTGASNSFNNKIGLQFLKPSETYDITWSLNINNN